MYIGTIHGFCLHMLQEFTDEYKTYETLNDVQTKLFIKKYRKYNGIFELRTKFASDITRIFYFTWSNNTFVLLNGFTKKAEKTSIRELDRALLYKKDYERRCKDE